MVTLFVMRIARVLLSCLLLFFASFVVATDDGVAATSVDCVASAGDVAMIELASDVPGEVDEFARIAPPTSAAAVARASPPRPWPASGLAEVFLPPPVEPPTPV